MQFHINDLQHKIILSLQVMHNLTRPVQFDNITKSPLTQPDLNTTVDTYSHLREIIDNYTAIRLAYLPGSVDVKYQGQSVPSRRLLFQHCVCIDLLPPRILILAVRPLCLGLAMGTRLG